MSGSSLMVFFFFQAEDGIRDSSGTGVQTCALPISWRVGALAVGLGSVRIIGLTGHSHDTDHPALSQVADFVHLSAISLWIGGLATLLLGVLPRRRPEELRTVVPGYSTLAMLCVLSVVGGGTVMAWQLLG